MEIRGDKRRYIPVLTIAGSDSSGGAGIQADIKTMSALGCYAASAITAITVQNTLGVTDVHAVPPQIVEGQIRAVMDDIVPIAAKVGMVNDAATIHAISSTLRDYHPRALVVDPVMVATSGSRLMQDDALGIFCRELLPLATLLTPNIPEAEVLSGIMVKDKSTMDEAAKRILALGCNAVLIKGGHLDGRKTDRLYIVKDASDNYNIICREYSTDDIPTPNTHGTGCTLSSAITAYMAQSLPIEEAISRAKAYLTHALHCGADVEIGHGHGPVCHFPNLTKKVFSRPNGQSMPTDAFSLQFITHSTLSRDYVEGARLALEGGCKWIQLRMKNASDDEVRRTAAEILPLCRHHEAIFLLDDRVELAMEIGADGVHLGKNDMPIHEARRMMGDRYIIGGTANTINDIRRIAHEGADYIGCGPFRFTTTKEKLSPTLGLEGYRNIIAGMRQLGIHLPIVAIGGITSEDIHAILSTGINGIAVSGTILNSPDASATTRQLMNIIKQQL